MTPVKERATAVEAFLARAASLGHVIGDDIAADALKAAFDAVARARAEESLRIAMAASRPEPALSKEEYEALLIQPGTVTLEQYRAMEEYDSNVFWRLEGGHLQNLLDAALEAIDALAAELDAQVRDRER